MDVEVCATYGAEGATGAGRKQVRNEVPVGTNDRLRLAECLGALFTLSGLHEIVFHGADKASISSHYRRLMSGLIIIISNIAFEDHDRDADDIGGELSWNEPTDIGPVTLYTVYLSEGPLGMNRSDLGNVSDGTANTMGVVDTTGPPFTQSQCTFPRDWWS